MNLVELQYPVFKPYNTPTLEIYLAGCTRNCKGCCNPELQDFNVGKPLIIEDLIEYLKPRIMLFKVISIVGGDLLCQNEEDALKLIVGLKTAFPTQGFWLFTGLPTLEQMPKWCFYNFDVIKYGEYKEELKQEGFPASSNQQIWKK